MKPICKTTAATLVILAASLPNVIAQDAIKQRPIGVLLAAGDIAYCVDKGDRKRAEATGKLALELAKQAEAENIPVRVLALGDLAYEDGSEDAFECFTKTWGEGLSKYLLPVPGNHEYTRSDPYYFKYFRQKNNSWVLQQEKEKGKKGARLGYFYLNFPDEKSGPWRLLGLNSEIKGPVMDEQIGWLTDKLQGKLENGQKPRCVLAFWHKPVLSSGMHGHGDCSACTKPDAALCRPQNAPLPFCKGTRTMLPAYRALFEQGASVVLTGHDHHYEQFAPHDPNGEPHAQGLRSFVVGTGGKELYRTRYTERWKEVPEGPREVYNHDTYGVLRIELYSDRYSWSFISITGAKLPLTRKDGVTIDNFTCNQRP